MSIRRDWFKNKVDILAQVAAAVLGLRGKGEVLAAAVKLEEGFRSAFGMDARLALALPFKDFLDLVSRGIAPSPELLAALAGFFHDWAGVLEAQNRPADAAMARERAAACRALPGPSCRS